MTAVPLSALTGPDLAIDSLVLGAAALLAVGVLATAFAERLRFPSLVVVLGLGMFVADDGLAWIRFDDAELAENLSVLALVVILFDGGLSTRWRTMRYVLAPASLLATVGVAVTATIIAATLVLTFGTDAKTAWLIGAVVASTDAAAVFAAMRRLPLPARLVNTLKVESGLNDPMAILLTVGFVEVQRRSVPLEDWLLFGIRQLGLGLMIGVCVGLVGAVVLERLRLPNMALHTVFASAIGAAAYGTAAVAHASGFLAVYLAGVVLAERAPRHRRGMQTFHEGLAAGAEVGLFFLLGILVFPSQLGDVAAEAITVALVLAFVARPLGVALSLVWFRWPARELAFLSWAGLRGAVPIVLATFPLTANHPDGQLIFDVVFFVVLVSTTAQGASMSLLARRLHLEDERKTDNAVIELTPTDSLAADLIEVDITSPTAVLGKPLRAVPPPGGARIALVSRDGQAFVPSGSTTLQLADHLVISAERGHIDPERIAAWLRGEPDSLVGRNKPREQ